MWLARADRFAPVLHPNSSEDRLARLFGSIRSQTSSHCIQRRKAPVAESDPPVPGQAVTVAVFAAAPGGGNPAPIVLDAQHLSDHDMQAVAVSTGRESGFVVAVPDHVEADVALRFWVPRHEMSMCGHATIAAVWLLARAGMLRHRRHLVVHTASGLVDAWIDAEGGVSIGQPPGRVDPIPAESAAVVARALGVAASDMAATGVFNAATSRVKTLVALKDEATLDGLHPDPDAVEAACEKMGSTGLYPFAAHDVAQQIYAARQFPHSSGYLEDPATGIAATALTFGLLHSQLIDSRHTVRIRQGWAMGRPSEITVDLEHNDAGDITQCRLSGPCAVVR